MDVISVIQPTIALEIILRNSYMISSRGIYHAHVSMLEAADKNPIGC